MTHAVDRGIQDTADAEALERAALVLERHHPQSVRDVSGTLRDRERIRMAIYTLKAEAQDLRGERSSV